MANITIYEFEEFPDAQGDLGWPASAKATVAHTDTHTLANSTRYLVLTCDADCRVEFNAAAAASGMNLLAAVPNYFRPRAGSGRTLQFTI